MKKTSVNSSRLSSSKRIVPLACSAAVILAVLGSMTPLASTLSVAMRSALNAAAPAPAMPAQSETSTFYLHGTGPVNNPPTLFLNTTAPTATNEKYKDSAAISRNNGNPWKEVGTWPAAAAMTTGTLTSLSDLHVWLGLKNSDDQGTFFDLRVEAYKNSTLMTSGQSLCITGITRNANSAKEVVLNVDPFSATAFNSTSDVLSLKVLTRVGTNANGSSCGGHSNAVGLRLYFDAVSRAARFNSTQGSSDTTPPVLTIVQPADNLITSATQINVTGTFSDQSPATITVNGVAATISGTSFSATVPLDEGANVLSVVAIDAAGNQGTATRNITLDTAVPKLIVQQPFEGSYVKSDNVTVSGTIADANLLTVSINGASATIADGRFSRTLSLDPGPNVLNVLAIDAAGNQTGVGLNVRRVTDNSPPILTVTSPGNQAVFKQNIVTVSGTAMDDLPVTLSANDVPITVGPNGGFTSVVHVPFGTSQLTFVAEDAVGNRTESQLSLTIDGSLPVISDVQPESGTTINSQTVTVTGRISDETPTSVTVNGISANMTSADTFEVNGVALTEGVNTLVVVATDQAGNTSTASLELTGGDRTPPQPPVFFPIKSETRLTFQTLEGRAEPGSTVRILGGLQPVTVDAAFGTGLFAAQINLAPGANTLTAAAEDAAGNSSPQVNVTITSNPNAPAPTPGVPYQINISTGSGQRGLNGVELPRPLIAVVTDSVGNPVPNVMVTFANVHGDGRFVGALNSVDVPTDADGHASTRYVCGAANGVYLVRADFSGNLSTPAIFIEESVTSENATTAVSGIVLDQNLRALPNVLARIAGQQTRTGADGRFRFENVPSGPHQVLELIGRDQITLPGRWPNISYDLDVLAGVENSLGRPLFLPKVNDGVALPLDAASVVMQDTTYELPAVGGQPPIKVTARAGTHVQFPPDATDKRLSVTRIATNRVPMTLEGGRATNLYISVQPSGAVFEPPLEITFPNLDRLAPNQETLLMSFDHDAGRYVQVGTGHVSADGQTIRSDAGSGIRTGAWHGFPPDPPQPEVTVLGHIKIGNNPVFKDKGILDAEAWVEGARAVLVTAGEIADVWSFSATYSLPSNAPAVARMEATVNAVKIDAEPDVQNVDADGNPTAGLRPSTAAKSPVLIAMALPARLEKNVDARVSPLRIESDSDNAPVLLQEEDELPTRYGGTTNEYSDHFDIAMDPQKLAGFIVRKFDWRVSGPGADTYHPPTPSADAIRWRFGKVNPYPGILEIKCVMTVKSRGARIPSTVVQSGTKRIQIGVNTDDVTVIGWINPDGVSVTGEGMDSHILAFYPLAGGASMSLVQKGLTLAHQGLLAAGTPIHPVYPRDMTPAERRHVLNWGFKFSGNFCNKNRCPPTSFGSNEAISAFAQQNAASFKLFNRYQVKYLVENGRFKLDPLAIRLEVEIGITHDPLFDVGARGDAGPANRRHMNLDNTTYLINDGTPASLGVSFLNTLMSPLKWNHIGDRIEFGIQYGALRRVYNQVYPTYYIFDNRALTETRPQAPEPSANFNRNPYPPGPAPYVP